MDFCISLKGHSSSDVVDASKRQYHTDCRSYAHLRLQHGSLQSFFGKFPASACMHSLPVRHLFQLWCRLMHPLPGRHVPASSRRGRVRGLPGHRIG